MENDIADLRRTDYKTDGVGREIMFERFFPDEYVVSTYVIPFERLYEEGYRGVIFDIDNTLVPHGAPADDRAKNCFGD